MKPVTLFESPDGVRFTNETDCQRYELLCLDIDSAMAAMNPRPDDIDFSNGGGYVQQTQSGVTTARARMVQTALDYFPKGGTTEQWFTEWRDGKRHVSHVARLVDDGNLKCLKAALYRFVCIDPQQREWGQPYYAMNPGKGTQKEWL